MVGKIVILEGEATEWLVLEDNGNRVLVEAQNTGLAIAPTETCNKRFILKVINTNVSLD
jgi:hypothetical protein